MGHSIFGWSYPPGCSGPPDCDEGPCDVCGRSVDDCICPECPVCQTHGDPACYENHGLTRTQEQIDGKEAIDLQRKADAEAEYKAELALMAFEKEGRE